RTAANDRDTATRGRRGPFAHTTIHPNDAGGTLVIGISIDLRRSCFLARARAGATGGFLPFFLGRQPFPAPRGVGVSVEPVDTENWGVEGQQLVVERDSVLHCRQDEIPFLGRVVLLARERM